MVNGKNPESSVTQEMINHIHLTLSNLEAGEDALSFLRETEPIFMKEVSRFVQTEINRMKYNLSESQTLYLGSIVGAAYIAGFLISREATNTMFNGLVNIETPISKKLDTKDINSLIDRFRDEGKSYTEIGTLLGDIVSGKPKKKNKKTTKKKTCKSKNKKQKKKLKIDNLDK